MKKGYVYKRETCPVCGEGIAENWYVRHMKERHPQIHKPELTWKWPRIARVYWTCPHCDQCLAEQIEQVDTSEGLPAYTTVICPKCGADLTFHLRWTTPSIYSVQLTEAGEPWFETEEEQQ